MDQEGTRAQLSGWMDGWTDSWTDDVHLYADNVLDQRISRNKILGISN